MDAEPTATLSTERKVVRRGLLAGLAGLGAAAMLKATGGNASAANGENLIIGNTANMGTGQSATAATKLTVNQAAGTGLIVTSGANPLDLAISGFTSTVGATGIQGQNNTAGGVGVKGFCFAAGWGVYGSSSDVAGLGMRGVNFGNGTGVKGLSNVMSSGPDGNGTGTGVSGRSASGRGVWGEATTGVGVRGYSNSAVENSDGTGSGIGVDGRSGSGTGVLGITASGQGVRGRATAGNGFGVVGISEASGIGVKGLSNVDGNLFADGNGSGIAVQGKSGSGFGVQGVSVSAPGVEGVSTQHLGVRGVSTNFVGVVGISTNNHGLYGFTSSATGVALVGDNAGGGLAGVFNGRVEVYGSFQVFGVKNAVLKMPDGTNALVYCQESPEPYFEDFGKAQLTGGMASIPIERDFAALVAGGEYLVFLTPEGDTRGLFVSRKGPAGFEVREVQGGTANVPFTYRIVTKRKDVEGKRFARVGGDGAKSVAVARANLGIAGTLPGNNQTAGNPPVSPPVVPNQPAPVPAGNPTPRGPAEQPGSQGGRDGQR